MLCPVVFDLQEACEGKTKPNTAVPAGLNKPDTRVVYQDYKDESHPEEGLISCSPLNDDVVFPGNLPGNLLPAGKSGNLFGPLSPRCGCVPPPHFPTASLLLSPPNRW